MVTVANPLYDIVFKYLLEDERIARILLSALLKEDVISVETRRNEYSNIARDSLSIFRIDFGATIRKADGSEQFVLIEIQKTWVETETLRFRQYLGAQYANPMNMSAESKGIYGIPMVTVYLLGHRLGAIEEPVLYVRRHSYDYNDRLVTKGLPDPFVESLTHDSIIVQIPLLHGQINNRLDKVLSVFDQTRQDTSNKQMLILDEAAFEGDTDMQLIVNRLLAAAADAKMRHNMNVEDEYFSVIEKRDTEIMMKDAEIARQDAKLSEQGAKLAEQDAKLAENEAKLAENEAKLAENEAKLAENEAKLAEKEAKLTEKEAKLTEKDEKLAEQDNMLRTSVQMLVDAGMPIETVAVSLNKDIDTIKRLLG